MQPFIIFFPKKQRIYDYFYEFASETLHIVIFESFIQSKTSCLSKLKVTPSFCFAFKIPDNPTATYVNKYLLHIYKCIFTYRNHLWFGDHLFSQCGHANLSYFDVCHCNQRSNCWRRCLLHDFKIFRYTYIIY